MPALQDDRVIGLCVVLRDIVRRGRKHVREGGAEARIVDEHVLRVVGEVVFRDIEHGHRGPHEAGHVVRGFERHVADPERNHAARVAVDHAVLARIAL